MKKLSVRDMDLRGKRILCRVDFNVPLTRDNKISDDTRIRAALPTIRMIMEKGGRLALCSHLGRPKGKPNPNMSLSPVRDRLAELLCVPVAWASDCVGEEAESMVFALKDGEVGLLENLRFHTEEESNDSSFAQALARMAEIFINDAFGSAHRAHASTEGVTHHVAQSGAGLLLDKEVTYLSTVMEDPRPPFLAILGGAKVSDKMGVIHRLAGKVDRLIVGGAMAYTFLKAKGIEVGSSLVEQNRLEDAKEMMDLMVSSGTQLLLPVDHLVSSGPEDLEGMVCGINIPEGKMGLDIGPETIKMFVAAVSDAHTVVWNGPLGMFEKDAFAQGTEAMARALAASGATVVVGGGDSAAALVKLGMADQVTHVSTGGGASLEMLEGKALPGVEALTDA